ncbi:Macrolide-specific efflux protein MacA [Minicystis rosea]|nr:Macrolide-specific efflux protein MacA [Minicystis rosea]
MPHIGVMATTTPDPTAGADDVAALLGTEPRPRKRSVIRLTLLFVAIAILGAAGFFVVRRGGPGSGPKYRTAEVARGDLRVTITATGTLQATTTVEVGAEVSGRILKMTVDANDAVKKGQVLAVIDPEQLRAAVDQASAQLAAADASIREATATRDETKLAAERARAQVKEGLASQKDLESAVAAASRAEAQAASAGANAALARAVLVSAKSKLDKATIVSPIDGVVLSRSMEPGQTVTAGFSTPVLFKIAEDLTRMRLDVDVDEADVGRAHEGQEASFTVEAYPARSFPSRVLLLLNEPKTSSNVVTYKGRLAVDNGERVLRPGMTATATIVSDLKPGVVLIPNAALRFVPPAMGSGPGGGGPPGMGPKRVGEVVDKDRKNVYVVEPTGLRKVAVRVGATDGTNTELLSNEIGPGAQLAVDTAKKE